MIVLVWFVHFILVTDTTEMPALVTADSRRLRWHKKLLECSLQDLTAIYMPYMAVCSLVAEGTCFIFDPTLKLLLYSALPESYQNWLTFMTCFVEEMRFTLMFIGVIVPVLQLQVISFDLITIHLEASISSAVNGYCKKNF